MKKDYEASVEYSFRETVEVEADSVVDAYNKAREDIYDRNKNATSIEVVSIILVEEGGKSRA